MLSPGADAVCGTSVYTYHLFLSGIELLMLTTFVLVVAGHGTNRRATVGGCEGRPVLLPRMDCGSRALGIVVWLAALAATAATLGAFVFDLIVVIGGADDCPG